MMQDGLAKCERFSTSSPNLLEHPEDLESAYKKSWHKRNTSWSWRASRTARTTSIQELSMDGTNLELLCKFMRMFDVDGNGNVDFDEFKKLIQVCDLGNLAPGPPPPNLHLPCISWRVTTVASR